MRPQVIPERTASLTKATFIFLEYLENVDKGADKIGKDYYY